jgi:4-hydroxy-tetrahydrodipicolinate synthase
VVANSFPAEFAQLVHMALAGNFEEARKFQSAIIDRLDMLFVENNPAGVKAFLSEQGLIKNILRLPLVPLSEHHLQALKKLL